MQLEGVRVALALGGGGARGCAHIGVIEELQERGAVICAIAGTSMGAVVGGLHAVGTLDAYRDWLRGLGYRDVLRLLDPALRAPGMIAGERVMARIRELVGEASIEDLPIPYTAVAADLVNGREVWLQRGSLSEAMRASIALPSIFTPVTMDGMLLADGGLLNQVPVTPLAGVRADLTIAVSVGGPSVPATGPAPARLEATASTSVGARDQDMLQRLRSLLGWERAGEGDPKRSGEAPVVSTFDVVELSILAMQRMITRYQLATIPPDVLIELPADMCGTMEFHRATEVIERGRAEARRVLAA